MPQCVAIKTNGDQCQHQCYGLGDRCGTHMNVIRTKGPNQTAKLELKYLHAKNMRIIGSTYNPETTTIDEHNLRCDREKLDYETKLLELNTRINEEFLRTGVNPDAEARQRANEARAIRMNLWRQRAQAARAEMNAQRNAQIQAQLHHANIANAVANVVDRLNGRQMGDLEAFARDNQNVHTRQVVENVKLTVRKILEIEIPPEFETETLRTPGEIILVCGLSKKAAWQMMAKYCSEESIYDMEGIYPKVLNAVWQFIHHSEDREDLIKILKSEMEDNIGMCAQGNLSRLCNILNGYLDGIQLDTESLSEKIGKRIAPLMEIESIIERVERAYQVMRELNVPANEWEVWIAPLMETDDEDLIIQNNQADLTIENNNLIHEERMII